jgi:osomolarity two-component system sensor histidine kinase NIK1
MTESLSVFADEVTRVAREVGTEGRLGGQARVTDVGRWVKKICSVIFETNGEQDLTDNVNLMAKNVSCLRSIKRSLAHASCSSRSKCDLSQLPPYVRRCPFWLPWFTTESQTAVARGDLTQEITGMSVSGEMLSLVNTIGDMIDQLAILAAEVKNACARSR